MTEPVFIAKRRIVPESTGGSFVITIHMPIQTHVNEDAEWQCSVSLCGEGRRDEAVGHGIDSLQALVDSLSAIRYLLAKTGEGWSWAGSVIPGYAGVPLVVPDSFGPKFSDFVENTINEKLAWLSSHDGRLAFSAEFGMALPGLDPADD